MAGWEQVKWSQARQVADLMELDLSLLDDPERNPESGYRKLRERGDLSVAIRYLGHALPRLRRSPGRRTCCKTGRARRSLESPNNRRSTLRRAGSRSLPTNIGAQHTKRLKQPAAAALNGCSATPSSCPAVRFRSRTFRRCSHRSRFAAVLRRRQSLLALTVPQVQATRWRRHVRPGRKSRRSE